MKNHINKHHRKASKGPDNPVGADSTAADPGDVLVTGELEHGYVGSSIPKDDEIEVVDLDSVIINGTETAVDPIAEIKEASDHGLDTGISCKECGKLYMGPNKVFGLMHHLIGYKWMPWFWKI